MKDIIAGFFAPWVIFAVILLLHLLLPARTVPGYVRDPRTGKPLRYRLNGPLVLVATVGLGVLACALGVVPWDWLYTHRWAGLAGACTVGLAFSLAVVLPAPGSGKPFPVEFYKGRRENPQFLGGRVDAKMFLYLVGATMLALNILSFAAHHVLVYGADASPGVYLHAALFLWFVAEYLVFERVHLYTYDLVAERVGFKLGWGCFTFYPYFYAVGLWAVQQGGRALWAVPAAFVLAMLGGGALAGWGIALPHVETGIVLSVLVLGLVVAARRHAPLTVGVAVAGGFALFHGYAHGLEMPLAASPALYGLGFVLATLGLHGLGIAGSLIGRHAVQVAGAGIAATGLALIFAL